MNQLGAVERRRRNLRIVLFAIILGTLPLYCLGFLLWGTSPQQNARTPTRQAGRSPDPAPLERIRTPAYRHAALTGPTSYEYQMYHHISAANLPADGFTRRCLGSGPFNVPG